MKGYVDKVNKPPALIGAIDEYEHSSLVTSYRSNSQNVDLKHMIDPKAISSFTKQKSMCQKRELVVEDKSLNEFQDKNKRNDFGL